MMATQKIEVDLSKFGPVLKPYLPTLLAGLTSVVSVLLAVGAALQKLDLELNGGKDAVPETKAGGPLEARADGKVDLADSPMQYDWEGK